MSRETAVEQLLDAHRELNPELYAKADAIAQIIDPSAWPGEAWDGVGPEAKRIDWDANTLVQVRRAEARGRAFRVLEYLGLYDPKEWCTPAFLAKAWGWKTEGQQSRTE